LREGEAVGAPYSGASCEPPRLLAVCSPGAWDAGLKGAGTSSRARRARMEGASTFGSEAYGGLRMGRETREWAVGRGSRPRAGAEALVLVLR
jgi:hypothetical protein